MTAEKHIHIDHPDQRYIGHTADLRERLIKHNKGDVPHTSKFRPWKFEVYIAFETEEKAVEFEHYLKSGSGHAFAKRHLKKTDKYGLVRTKTEKNSSNSVLIRNSS